jgi:hypothetical protein
MQRMMEEMVLGRVNKVQGGMKVSVSGSGMNLQSNNDRDFSMWKSAVNYAQTWLVI